MTAVDERYGGLTVETVGQPKPDTRPLAERAAAHFAEDTARHDLTVVRDEAGERVLRWCRTDSWMDGVEIRTWRNVLMFTGDRGTFMFRIWGEDDILPFFNHETINPYYWGQKVEASDDDGVRAFSEGDFRAEVTAEVEEWIADQDSFRLDDDAADDLRETVEREVLAVAEFGGEAARVARYGFAHEVSGVDLGTGKRGTASFDFNTDDLDSRSYTEFTFRFLWACHAVRAVAERYYRHVNAERAAAERLRGTLPRDESDRVWRVVWEKPVGADEPGWAPGCWPTDGDHQFRWPRDRGRYLSRSGAVKFLRLVESYGASGYVQASEPVAWSDRASSTATRVQEAA